MANRQEHTPIHVLLLADGKANPQEVSKLLHTAGAFRLTVHHVTATAETLRLLRDTSPDVVLLYLARADNRGLAAIGEIQAIETSVPVVVLSERDDEAVALRAMHSGAEDFIVLDQTDAGRLHRAIRYALERKRAHGRLAYLAHYDPLTGLANRVLFRDQLERAIVRARRSGAMLAVMFLDLDRFKPINDTLGHDVGDNLLKEVAQRIKTCVRGSDTVARMGGDEFTVLLEHLDSERSAQIAATKTLEALRHHFAFAGRTVSVTCSIGVAVYPEAGQDAETLIQSADAAMYKAKKEGKDHVKFHTPDMSEQARERRTLESGLRRALEKDELSLEYQPIIQIATGKVLGVEALLRWHSREFGTVDPMDFIAMAEETGLIVPIGEWVLHNVCAQMSRLRARGVPEVRLAVNFSARQFRQADFAVLVEELMHKSGFQKCPLVIEVKEAVLMEDFPHCEKQLAALKEMGIKISVDDFGTGFSSLGYLKKIPVDTLKIDRSFVQDLKNGSDAAEIASAIIALAHSLHMEVVAEGVETQHQMAYLKSKGCEAAQGYFFSAPLSAQDCLAYLAKHRAVSASQH